MKLYMNWLVNSLYVQNVSVVTAKTWTINATKIFLNQANYTSSMFLNLHFFLEYENTSRTENLKSKPY